MSETFDPDRNLVLVRAVLSGPQRSTILRMALDTGATVTMINCDPLVWVGYDLSSPAATFTITTAGGMERVPRVQVHSLEVLGRRQVPFKVLGHTLPASAQVDGLLGLDFLRGGVLTVDFTRGVVSLG